MEGMICMACDKKNEVRYDPLIRLAGSMCNGAKSICGCYPGDSCPFCGMGWGLEKGRMKREYPEE